MERSEGLEKYEVKRDGIKMIYEGDRILYSFQFNVREFRIKCRKQYFIFTILQFILALISVSLNIVQLEFSRNAENTPDYATVYLFIFSNIGTCFLSFVSIIFRYNIKYTLSRVRMSYRISFLKYLILHKKLLKFVFEIIFNWLFAFSPDRKISSWLVILTIFKLYPIILINNCLAYIARNKFKILQNIDSFNLTSPVFGNSLNLRYTLQNHGFLVVFVVYSVIVLFFSYLFYSSNRPSKNVPIEETRDFPYHVTVYWALITTTTTGYGDISPIGYYQKTISIILVFLGVFISSIITGVVTTNLKLKDNEMQALKIAEKKMLLDSLDNYAIKVIQYSYRIKKYQGCEAVTSALLKNPRFMELQRHLLNALTMIQRIQHILKHDYNFDTSKKTNDQSSTLISHAAILNDYHETLDKQINYLNTELTNLLELFNVKPVPLPKIDNQ
ncbi:hypothetical protein TRFO_18365 [Tritrichomonas foetus]|uniref:Potassium channel domain-containing protein n=1 Tax=Tritrichomonas foetus TaxID=1144522 RepID=A0A1J4KQN9_9EUKA|nr:hypothetical protein TRFO_18365 [Tritrichomonas foetus]|eukprot:OHT11982.1 hypothetical protein TRFO_18365 [Tritrichomonas foetus]